MRAFNTLPRGRAEAGFSYLWLLFMMALIALNLSLAAQIDTTILRRDREAELLMIGHQFRLAIEQYQKVPGAEGRNEYPMSLDELLRDGRHTVVRHHLRKLFVDPLSGKAEWGVVRIGGRIVGVHSLSSDKPLKQGGFELEDSSFQNKSSYAEWVFTHPPGLFLGDSRKP